MRVGAFARSLMLRGECSVDLVLMCTGKTQCSRFRKLFIVHMMSSLQGSQLQHFSVILLAGCL